MGPHSISCRFKNTVDGFIWVFTGVYGPLSSGERNLLWDELGAIKGLWEDPWCVGGDFNIIRFPSERNRSGRLNQSMRRFSEVIDAHELIDLPLLGRNFTWSGGSQNHYQSRLDRFLISQDWLDHVEKVEQLKLPKPTSDHAPILFECGGLRRGPTPFRFENMWLKVEGFLDLMKRWWQGVSARGSASFIL